MFKNLLLLTFLFFNLNCFTQYQVTLSDYLPLLNHNNGDLLFNPLAVNPALSDDQVQYKGHVMFQERWIGISDSPLEVNIAASGRIPNTMHSVGMEMEWWGNSDVRNQLLRLNYSYKHIINSKHSVKGGANLDFASFKLKADNIHGIDLTQSSDSYFYPNLHLGVNYTYKNRSVGLAYGGIFMSQVEGTRRDFALTQRGLLINYSSSTPIGSLLLFQSGILLNTDFENFYYYVSTKFTFKEIISCGVFYNSKNKAKGLVASGIILERYEIGYQFYFDVQVDQLLGGHSFFLGYRLPD